MTAQIKLKHSGGNGVIIEAPASNPASDKTITLPSDETGVFATKDSANSLQNVTGINGGQLGNRNLIINGAMQVAQRGTSSTSSGIHTVDRFTCEFSGTDASPTQEHETVAAGTEPYTLGFRRSFKVVNGNQTSGAGASDFINIQTKLEAQDIANSGWNYTSSSSYVTLSFWIRSTVAQNFKCFLRTRDGTEQRYAFDTGSLSANTWTKITKTIQGNSNITIDNDNGEGLQINIGAFWGGTFTDNSVTEDAWGAYSGSTRMKDNTSTWYSTNLATLQITGVQLEVGSVATDFEHRSFGQELALCQRYCCKWHTQGGTTNNHSRFQSGYYTTSSQGVFFLSHPVPMRATDGRSLTHNIGNIESFTGGGSSNSLSIMGDGSSNMITPILVSSLSTVTANTLYACRVASGQTNWYLIVSAEL